MSKPRKSYRPKYPTQRRLSPNVPTSESMEELNWTVEINADLGFTTGVTDEKALDLEFERLQQIIIDFCPVLQTVCSLKRLSVTFEQEVA